MGMDKRGLTVLCLAILCCCVWMGGQAAEATWEIPIVIKERAGLDWKNTPITVGVPVPAGDPSALTPPRVLDPWGREVPSQATMLSASTAAAIPTWWRITFFGTINRRDSLVYRIVPGKEKRVLPRTVVTVEKTDTGYTVKNSNLMMELRVDQTLIGRAWFDPSGKGNFREEVPILPTPWELGIRTTEGTLTTGAVETRIEVEESGPVRAVFRISGALTQTGTEGPFTYEGRLIFFAESPFIHLQLKLINTTGQPLSVEEAWIKTSFNFKGERLQTTFGSMGKNPKTGALRQSDQAQVQIDATGQIRWGGVFSGVSSVASGEETALGWVDLTGNDWGLGLGVKNFLPQYPKGLQVTGTGGIQVQLLTEASRFLWEAGVAKTHQMTLYFHSARDRDSLTYLEAVTNKPPAAIPTANGLNQTGVFGQPFLTDAFLAQLDPEVRPMALLLKEKFRSELLNLYGPSVNGQEINPAYWGFFNYGDLPMDFSVPWAVAGEYWNNNAYDLPFQLLCAYLESEDPAFLELGEAALTHWQDIDLANPAGLPRPFPGLEHLKEPREGRVSTTGDFRYLSNRSLLLGYYLLDDPYGYELALRMADRVTLQAGVDLNDLRTIEAGLMTVLAAYQVTGRQRYLDRATELVELVLTWQEEQGGSLPTDFIYKAGLVTDALVSYYRITRNPRVLTGIQKAVDYALAHFWNGRTGFIQNTGGILFTSALDLLYRETGDQKYYDYNKTQVQAFANGGTIKEPKEVALFYRNVFSFFNGASSATKE
jgi:hypothetical protein